MSNSVLPIQLTVGWPIPDEATLLAKVLHSEAQENITKHTSYEEELKNLFDLNSSTCSLQLDQLLRRRTGGFIDINTFAGALLSIWGDLPEARFCSIDIFAFAFLKHAKNYDLFMQPDPETLDQLQAKIKGWQRAIQALEDFERLGLDLAPEYSHLKQVYLSLRVLTSRPSARDEQLTLSVLLVCGPLTRDEISSDLGLNCSLNQRIMVALQATGAIENRHDGDEIRYLINEAALPVCLFVVREIIGLDLLAMVADLKEWR